jgi:hypothetical protein
MRSIFKATLVAAALASLWLYAGPSAVAGSSLAEGKHRFEARQSISYEFGSKAMSGVFVAQSGACLVTLMVIEKSPSEDPLPFNAMRLRLILKPGQIAGLDSEEGRSLNFTCDAGAKDLVVDAGETATLAAAQTLYSPARDEAQSR